jgi:tetratricopeptide (TPR) repeat protein
LKLPVPAGFRDKVVRAADRWRALDRDQEKAARAAAAVLRTLGEREMAWDYLTTPVALRPGESDVWVSLATTLQRQGDRDLADRAYQAACEREATNAQLVWDRADNLKQAGRLVQAQALYRQIAEGDWQPRFATLKTQARWLLEGR